METAIATVRTLPPRAAIAREAQRLWRSEIRGSTALAGSPLSAGEVDALLDRGVATGGHPLAAYLVVRGYADASRWVAEQRPLPLDDARPLLNIDELRHLHARAVDGTGVRGGAWRLGNPAPRDRIVPPPPWLISREVATLMDRFARGPRDAPVALWIARYIARFDRIRPFEAANGRTARLTANAMLRRLDMQPLVFEPNEADRYARALLAAESDDPLPLADLIATAVLRACDRLRAAASAHEDPLRPLRELAGGDYAALAKAAQRGRLRTLVRGGRRFTTAGWIAAYRENRSSAGRPPAPAAAPGRRAP